MVAITDLPPAPLAATPAPIAPSGGIHPAANAATSSGVAGALDVLLVWALSLVHVTVPADVETAIGVLLTASIGYALHRCSQPKPGVSP